MVNKTASIRITMKELTKLATYNPMGAQGTRTLTFISLHVSVCVFLSYQVA